MGKLPWVFLRLWRHIESLVMDVEPSSLKVSRLEVENWRGVGNVNRKPEIIWIMLNWNGCFQK